MSGPTGLATKRNPDAQGRAVSIANRRVAGAVARRSVRRHVASRQSLRRWQSGYGGCMIWRAKPEAGLLHRGGLFL